ncbi:MAG: hypothetical protein OSJ36_10725 [Odoribacter sp.]|nr:hypothetical protein [Odoribacter sp.]
MKSPQRNGEVIRVYVWKNNGSTYEHMGANIQKSIKIDRETLDIINGCGGRSFSDKVRNMAKEYREMKRKDS